MKNEGWWALTGIVTAGTVVLLKGRRLLSLLRSSDDEWEQRYRGWGAREAEPGEEGPPPGR